MLLTINLCIPLILPQHPQSLDYNLWEVHLPEAIPLPILEWQSIKKFSFCSLLFGSSLLILLAS